LVFLVLEFQGASAAANLQLSAVLAFLLHVLPFAQFLCQRVVPDFFPGVREDVAKAFEVALAGVNVAVGSDAGVDHGGSAAFDS
jgi:hypothetical protein